MHGFNWTNSIIYFAGSGNSRSYRLDADKYKKVKNLRLIPGTILFGEFVKEKVESAIEQDVERYSLHVIDALRLGEFDLANLPFTERLVFWRRSVCLIILVFVVD